MSKQVQEILDQACARNATVGLHFQGRAASIGQAMPPIVTAQSRMLTIDAKHLNLDAPQSIGQRVHLKAGDSVDGYFSLRGVMYGFRTTVVSSGRPVKINRRHSVPGLCLATPKELNDGQRRGDYRVILVRDEPIFVQLCEAEKASHDRCRVNAARFEAQMINLSRGGFSLRVEAERERHLRERGTYFTHFQIPSTQEQFWLMVCARHIRPILHGEAIRAGMQFLVWPDPAAFRRQLNRIGAYLVEIERKQCRSVATVEPVSGGRP